MKIFAIDSGFFRCFPTPRKFQKIKLIEIVKKKSLDYADSPRDRVKNKNPSFYFSTL